MPTPTQIDPNPPQEHDLPSEFVVAAAGLLRLALELAPTPANDAEQAP